MARMDYLNLLKCKEKSMMEFNFDTLTLPSMINWIQPYQIQQLENIATSARYSANMQKKIKEIKGIMKNCGCRTLHAGTNRIAFVPYECKDIVFKVAIDTTGMQDNPREYQNQQILKPCVTKLTEVFPSGIISTVERVMPIMSIQEFQSIASDVFDMITKRIIGKYVMEDIGSEYFMNYGVRPGWGPVLLDFPYLFELDGGKLYCNDTITGQPCGGQIDYDIGFNKLLCTKCGKIYDAKTIAKAFSTNEIKIIKRGVDLSMKSVIRRGNKIVKTSDGGVNAVKAENEFQSKSIIRGGSQIHYKNEKSIKFDETDGEKLKELGLEPVKEDSAQKEEVIQETNDTMPSHEESSSHCENMAELPQQEEQQSTPEVKETTKQRVEEMY